MVSAQALSIGIGCRRDTPAAEIENAVRAALGTYRFEDIRAVATLDAKADEPGVREFCARHALPLLSFTRAQIASTPSLSAPSRAAREALGVDGVCEPCALLALPGGELVVGKSMYGAVTVAIARFHSHI
jgi:cobalt-precorrin 5A hydrolase